MNQRRLLVGSCAVIWGVILVAGLIPRALADWSQFRGSDGTAVSTEAPLPEAWSAEQGVVWRIPLPGRANSSPAVTSQRIDLTSQTEDGSLWVLCIDRESGSLRHKVNVGRAPVAPPASRFNAATPTPCSEENHVWAHFASGLLVCVDTRDGIVVWKRDLAQEYGEFDGSNTMASSPLLWKNLLFLNCLTRGPSYVLAVDKSTGDEVWISQRRFNVPAEHQAASSTPVVTEVSGREELIVSGAGHVNAYDPQSGDELWRVENPALESSIGRVVASPVCGKKAVLGCCPSGAGKGKVLGIIDNRPAWEYTRATPDSSTPVIVNGLVYLVSDQGLATCIEEQTGKLVWEKRLGGGPYHASIVAGDGKVYFLGIDGVCTVMAQGREGRILARNTLAGTFFATPAISDGTIYLRAYEVLYAVQ